jgi:hypothetical protein
MAQIGSRFEFKPLTEDEKTTAQKAASEMQTLALGERFLCYRLLPHGPVVKKKMDDYGYQFIRF